MSNVALSSVVEVRFSRSSTPSDLTKMLIEGAESPSPRGPDTQSIELTELKVALFQRATAVLAHSLLD